MPWNQCQEAKLRIDYSVLLKWCLYILRSKSMMPRYRNQPTKRQLECWEDKWSQISQHKIARPPAKAYLDKYCPRTKMVPKNIAELELASHTPYYILKCHLPERDSRSTTTVVWGKIYGYPDRWLNYGYGGLRRWIRLPSTASSSLSYFESMDPIS